MAYPRYESKRERISLFYMGSVGSLLKACPRWRAETTARMHAVIPKRCAVRRLDIGLSIFLAFTLGLIPSHAHPSIKKAEIEYRRFIGPRYFPGLPRIQPKEYIGLKLDIHITDRLTWENRVFALTSESKFEWVGWNHGPRFRALDWLHLKCDHLSEHRLDERNDGPYSNQLSCGGIIILQ